MQRHYLRKKSSLDLTTSVLEMDYVLNTGSFISIEWMKMFQRDKLFYSGLADVSEKDNHVQIKKKILSFGVSNWKVEAPRRKKTVLKQIDYRHTIC